MSLSEKDRRMFKEFIQSVQHTEHAVDDLQYPLLNCASVEWMLLKTIKYGTSKWTWDGDTVDVRLGSDYGLRLVLQETGTLVCIHRSRSDRLGRVQLPSFLVSTNVWFGAYDRAMKDRGEITLHKVFEDDYLENCKAMILADAED